MQNPRTIADTKLEFRRVALNDVYRTQKLALEMLTQLQGLIPDMLTTLETEPFDAEKYTQQFVQYQETYRAFVPNIKNILHMAEIHDLGVEI